MFGRTPIPKFELEIDSVLREPTRARVQPTVRGQEPRPIAHTRRAINLEKSIARRVEQRRFGRRFRSNIRERLVGLPLSSAQPATQTPKTKDAYSPVRLHPAPSSPRSTSLDRSTRVAKPPIAAFPPQEFGPIPEIPSTRAADDPFTSRRDRSALKSRAATSRSLTPNSTTSRSPAAGSPSSSASRPTPPRLASASTPRGRRKSSSR